MSGPLIAVTVLAVIFTSTLSGVFGMAGGMILMGVMAWALPVSAAMMLHGATQAASTGSRAVLHWRHIKWELLGGYLVGAGLAAALFAAFRFVPSKAVIFLTLGLLPFAANAVPASLALDITKRGASSICGFIVTSFQLIAGVSGPALDMFYARSPLTRHEVVASKAVSQTLGHLIKLVYFGVLVGVARGEPVAQAVHIPWWVYALLAAAAMVGTLAGKQVLDRLPDNHFRKWSQIIIMTVGAVFVLRGLALL